MTATGAMMQVEQAGELREAALPLAIGGEGADLILPAPPPDPLRLERAGAQWWLRLPAGAAVLVNGRPVTADRALVPGDVFECGGAQLLLGGTAQLPRLSVFPLQGNETIAPFETFQMPGEEVSAGAREIEAAGPDAREAARDAARMPASRTPVTRRLAWAAAALLLALVAGLLAVVPVAFELSPATARLDAPEDLHIRIGNRLLMLPGRRGIEVSNEGYRTERLALEVSRALAGRPPVAVKLSLLPGALRVDTGGLAAEVLVDDSPAGSAPGVVPAPAGRHTVIVRAPRHLDHVIEVDVAGAGREQPLQVQLAPAWGWLELDARPAGARIAVDGVDHGTAPQRIELDSGLRQIEVSAPGRRSWRGSVAIVPGQTLALGTVDLAAPPPAIAAPPAVAAVATPDETSGGQAAPPAGPPPARVQSPTVGTLILLPAGTFRQGSERREQGRRSNETLREVTLTRPFYLAEREVTNGQFRLFRAAHASGVAIDRTLDLDAQPVSGVSWDEAVEFCNWLSQREGLPVAYERRDGRWQLVEPRVAGYRLPTEAEWEYAARFVDGQRWNRFSWGDALPMPRDAENVAGEETLGPTRTVARGAQVLPGHRDEYPVAAPVGSHGRTAKGFSDIGGNVSEWTHDVYSSLLPGAPATDPVGESKDGPHVMRGANWSTASVQALRLAWREGAAGPRQVLGFRVARDAGGAR